MASLLFGPPFPTGDPHYGHLINFILKDTLIGFLNITKGTDIRFDVHGLPTEQKVQSLLKISSIKEIKTSFGIKKYNEECIKYIKNVMEKWPVIFKDVCPNLTTKGESTMDYKYMKKVWKLFKILYDKGLVYESLKVQPYCSDCETCISNFEAKSNYKTVTENSIYVLFKYKPEIQRDFTVPTYFIVWTTTPFTLPSNTALCVNKNIKYVIFKTKKSDDPSFYIASSSFFEKEKKKLIFETEISTEELIGSSYDPPFMNYESDIFSYTIIEDSFVTEEVGTGIVHISPFFGEDDHRVYTEKIGLKSNLISSDPTDTKVQFISDCENLDLKNKGARDCNSSITKELKNRSLIFKEENITHEFPFCWRCDIPLYYKIIPTLNLNVESVKDKVLKNFDKINFVNSSGRERMRHGIETAPDWCISRTRIWGTPIPYWKDEKTGGVIVLDELYSTEKEQDLHLDKIPPFFSFSKEGEKEVSIRENGCEQSLLYKHCEYVFDCWFESGAQFYCEEDALSSDLIIEGIDQTRGWFYTLLVLGTAVQYDSVESSGTEDKSLGTEDKSSVPYKNVIVNGIVMDKNGVKFSKKLQNYKSVNDLLENYGIDAVRLYFLNSPASKGINFKFNEDDIRGCAKDIIIPLQNVVELFCEYSQYNSKKSTDRIGTPTDLDKYIINTYNLFKNTVIQEVTKKYDVTNIVRYLSKFVFDFSTTYCIFNKDEIKSSASAVSVVGYIIKDLNETILKHITPVLYSRIRERLESFVPQNFEQKKYIYTFDIEKTIEIIHDILAFRTASNIPLKRYLNRVLIANIPNLDLALIKKVGYILNEVSFESAIFLKVEYKPLYKEIGKDFGKDTQKIVNSILKGEIESIDAKYFEVVSILPLRDGYETVNNSLYIDVSSTTEIENFYTAKLLTTEIQTLRKKCGLKVYDTVILYVKFEEDDCLYDIVFKSEPITAYVKDILKTENITFCKENEIYLKPLIDSLDCAKKTIKLKEKSVKIELFF